MLPTSEMETFAEVNLSAIRANVKAIRSYINPAQIIAVIKADAYGHGALPCAKAAMESGVGYLGAGVIEEGI
ncbi:TPA: alanine racemase, partial [Candidatus Poribacteria bacterium]|nr:alanine racemase [Candidatus Poribacteria bacterium]